MRWLLLVTLVLTGCLRPIGFPWLDESTGASTGETSAAETADLSSTTGDSTTAAPVGETETAGASSTGASASSSTGGPPAFCGDGALDLPLEECDDGNTDPADGCNLVCARDRTVFATSMALSPDLIGGLAGADSLCKQLAGKADLPRSETYVAWLSDAFTDARDRVFLSRGRYVRVDQVVVARDAEELLSGALQAPISRDELGAEVGGSVWTGTRPDGTRAPDSTHCEGWTSASLLLEDGYRGHAGGVDASWTLDPDPLFNPSSCAGTRLLYCFEGE